MWIKKSVDSVMIEMFVQKLNNGKAAGEDGICSEHLTFCHPIVFSAIAIIFNVMLKFGYVSNSFGRGIIIPIPKVKVSSKYNIEDFRGITLCNIISTVFEHCIVLLCKQYLTTSDRQFGFKQKSGCNHAIYTLRQTVEYNTKLHS